MATLWDELFKYMKDASPGGALNPELGIMPNIGAQDVAGNMIVEPEGVPSAGTGLSPLSSQALQNYGMDWARFGKGLATGTVGMPGDIISLGRGVMSAMTPAPQQSRLDALLAGLSKPTGLPTSQDVSTAIDPFLPKFMTGQSAPQTIGEIAAPVGTAMKLVKEAAPVVAKGADNLLDLLPKNVPVGASVKPVANAPVSDLGFYSALEEAGLNLQRNKGTGQAFLNELAKAPNVKSDEIKWIGLDDYLKDKPNATREEVQQFIANNKVDVQEVQLGAGTIKTFDQWAADQGLTPEAIRDFGPSLRNSYEAFKENASQMEGAAKFGSYTLPGGENYREILLTMPIDREKYARSLIDPAVWDRMDEAQRSQFMNAPIRGGEAGTFKSPHWEQPNVLAHLRVNDRVDADGKKMLLIEEVQSDWHQAGRDKGYKQPANEARLTEINQRLRELAKSDKENTPEWDSLTREKNLMTNNTGVPDAPFKDNWYQLALKRALKYAADNGYERVGLTTGSRQAERYDLRKHLNEINYRQNPDGTFNLVAVDKNGRPAFNESGISESQLESLVGKEVAQKIVAGKGKDFPVGSVSEGNKSLSGLDLQIGGEGMKKYYDEIYPKFLDKYGKKWGAKVGETKINYEQWRKVSASHEPRTEPVRYIDITPEMRKGVEKGQPMFGLIPSIGAGAGANEYQKRKQNSNALLGQF